MAELAAEIIIDQRLKEADPGQFALAKELAIEVQDIAHQPDDLIGHVLVRAESVLADPATEDYHLATVELDKSGMRTAHTLLELLRITENGRYLDFDDTIADVQADDPAHRDKIIAMQNSGGLHIDQEATRRTVAISALSIYNRYVRSNKTVSSQQDEVA
jgi:hypothetical protein